MGERGRAASRPSPSPSQPPAAQDGNYHYGAFTASVRAIVNDFETRDHHLTGVEIADTALMLPRLAERRGMPAAVKSALLPSTT